MNVLDKFSIQIKVSVVTRGIGLYDRCTVEGVGEAGAKAVDTSRSLRKYQETVSFYQKKDMNFISATRACLCTSQ